MPSIEQRVSRMEAAMSIDDPFADWTDAELDERIHQIRQSILLSFVRETDLLAGSMREADRPAVTRLVAYLRRIDALLQTDDSSHALTDVEFLDATRTCRSLIATYKPDAAVLAAFDKLMAREEDTWPR